MQLELRPRTWGGARTGAGRKPSQGRRGVPHRRRERHEARCPVHVTLRATPTLPSLRADRVFPALRGALARSSRHAFRVLEFSVQQDHVHLLVEADGSATFTRGLQGLAIRAAKAVNRALGRHGRVWGDRYHARMLVTPREVRNALVYVLQNVRKHVPHFRGLDSRSSAAWFSGWRTSRATAGVPSPVACARTWLAAVGWQRHGLIDESEGPQSAGRMQKK